MIEEAPPCSEQLYGVTRPLRLETLAMQALLNYYKDDFASQFEKRFPRDDYVWFWEVNSLFDYCSAGHWTAYPVWKFKGQIKMAKKRNFQHLYSQIPFRMNNLNLRLCWRHSLCKVMLDEGFSMELSAL